MSPGLAPPPLPGGKDGLRLQLMSALGLDTSKGNPQATGRCSGNTVRPGTAGLASTLYRQDLAADRPSSMPRETW